MATVINGKYGYYFPYKDENGNSKGIKILDEVYHNYYKHGYLTDQHIENMLAGKTINFNVPKKSGFGEYNVTAKIIPYTTINGKQCKIIQFKSDKVEDKIIIQQNAEKIVCSYWDDYRFNYVKPQQILDTLDLDTTWKTWSQNNNIGSKKYGVVKVYKPRSRQQDEIILYCEVDNGMCKMVSEEQYKSSQAKAQKEYDIEQEQKRIEQENISKVRKELVDWLNSIVDKLWEGTNESSSKQLIVNAEDLTKNISVPNIEDRIMGLFTTSRFGNNSISGYIEKAKTDIIRTVNIYTYNDPEIVPKFKNNLLNNIKVYLEYLKLQQFRKDLLNDLNNNGIEALTENINIDTALDLGYFTTVQKILVKYKTDTPKYIITQSYLDVINEKELKEKILNLLKVYYEFYNMPEKDRKSVAKFIAKNRLSDYYERISKFDDVLETLIDESRDPKLTKPLLESIAGTSRANYLKDKTFYFEKRGRLKSDILLFKPIELLNMLRDLIKEFNSSSDVAILTNIELDADESFIFQFYTFAGNSNASGEFDGRRMLNLTRIFNRNHPNEKIGFNFENKSNSQEQ